MSDHINSANVMECQSQQPPYYKRTSIFHHTMTTNYLPDQDLEHAFDFSIVDEDDMDTNSFMSDLPDVFTPSVAVQEQNVPIPSGLAMLEPTPISPRGIVVVEKLPVEATPWHRENLCRQSLSFLLETLGQESSSNQRYQEPRMASVPSYCDTTELYAQVKGNHHAEQEPGPLQQMIQKWPADNTKATIGISTDDQFLNNEDFEGSSSGSEASSYRSSHEEQWNQRCRELQCFQREHGHCLVPLTWPKNPSLAHWVKRQRYLHRVKLEGRRSTLTDERQKALEALGFVWDSHAAGWEERWNELREFKEVHGHCNVPKKYPPNQQLAVWVKCQRRQFKLYSSGKSSNMTLPRIERLQILDFVFDPRSSRRSTTTRFPGFSY